jgi:hypothetical protein
MLRIHWYNKLGVYDVAGELFVIACQNLSRVDQIC